MKHYLLAACLLVGAVLGGAALSSGDQSDEAVQTVEASSDISHIAVMENPVFGAQITMAQVEVPHVHETAVTCAGCHLDALLQTREPFIPSLSIEAPEGPPDYVDEDLAKGVRLALYVPPNRRATWRSNPLLC